jgi:NADPH:quinone reductase-like Zn-dependent oxidoreductase
MKFLTGAGIPVAGKTALESLHMLNLEPGRTLFVAGASGAIGTFVVQLAARRGIRVAASASAPNHEYLLSLGAEEAVDYTAMNWEDQVREWKRGGVDAALAIQPGTGVHCQSVVREGGHVVTVSGDRFKAERNIRVEQLAHRDDASHDFAELLALVAGGCIRVVVERVYAFEDALTALEKTETRHARGKLVVTGPAETVR